MKIEIRNDSVEISGYVNAIERESKVLHTREGKPFVEKISSGAFRRSLARNDNVRLLLNHDKSRQLGSTKENLTLTEDNIGLRAVATVTDRDVIDKARKGQLSGWSFGFIPLRDTKTSDNELEHRSVSELDLLEVSILENTRVPAYDGTLIEARELDSEVDLLEIRVASDDVETVDNSTPENEEQDTQEQNQQDNVKKENLNYEFSNRYYKAKIKG